MTVDGNQKRQMRVFRVNRLSENLIRDLEFGHKTQRLVCFDVLPFVMVPIDHDWNQSTPPELSDVTFSSNTLNVARGIDVALNHALLMRHTWAINGNRWAVESRERPPFYFMSSHEIGTIEPNRFLFENMRIAHPCFLNLSLQMKPGEIIDEHHVLSIAIEYASKVFLTVVAAGNWGVLGPDSLSPLAKLPWTVAVGATTDEDGQTLLPSSSTGKAGEIGIDFVANGQNRFVDAEQGTSFAAPVVCGCIMFISAFILQLRSVEETLKTLRLAGVPVLHKYLVDTGFHDFDPKPKTPLPMLPEVGLNREVIREALEALAKYKSGNVFEPRQDIIFNILQACACPIQGYSKHEIGHGFISDTIVFDFLVELTVQDLLAFFVAPEVLHQSIPENLRSSKVTNERDLSFLYEITGQSGLNFVYDFENGQVISSMGASSVKLTGENCDIRSRKHIWPDPPSF